MRIRFSQNFYMQQYNRTALGKYHSIKTNLKRRNVSMMIEPKEFVDWWNSKDKICHYCNVNLVRDKKSLYNLTIDRKNNGATYNLSNIVFCCWRCNIIKGSWFTEKEMLEIAHKYLKKRI